MAEGLSGNISLKASDFLNIFTRQSTQREDGIPHSRGFYSRRDRGIGAKLKSHRENFESVYYALWRVFVTEEGSPIGPLTLPALLS